MCDRYTNGASIVMEYCGCAGDMVVLYFISVGCSATYCVQVETFIASACICIGWYILYSMCGVILCGCSGVTM